MTCKPCKLICNILLCIVGYDLFVWYGEMDIIYGLPLSFITVMGALHVLSREEEKDC